MPIYANTFSASEAIFQLLDELEAGKVLTVGEVETMLDVSEKQAREYLAFLEDRGRAEAWKKGRTKHYSLARRGGGDLPEYTEAVVVAFAVSALGILKDTAFYKRAYEQLSELEDRLHERHGPTYARLRSAFYPVPSSVPDFPEHHASHTTKILEAIQDGHRLRGWYQRLVDGGEREYRLEPLYVVLHHDGLHLVARKDNGDIRMFDVEGFVSLDRVRSLVPDIGFDPEVDFEHAFGRYTGFEPRHVELRLTGQATRQVGRRKFHRSQQLGDEDDGGLEVTFHVGLCPEFKAWLISLVPEVEVVEPVELREELRQMLIQGLRRNQPLQDDGS